MPGCKQDTLNAIIKKRKKNNKKRKQDKTKEGRGTSKKSKSFASSTPSVLKANKDAFSPESGRTKDKVVTFAENLTTTPNPASDKELIEPYDDSEELLTFLNSNDAQNIADDDSEAEDTTFEVINKVNNELDPTNNGQSQLIAFNGQR